MTQQPPTQRRGSYGIDAPYAFAFIALMALVYMSFAIIAAIGGRYRTLVPAVFMLTIVTVVFHSTLRGKFIVWSKLLDSLSLRGDERILDLGCGRGAVLLMAAQRLSGGANGGRAVGIDLWRNADQSGNAADATQRNAALEGVADRVELHTADMTSLPFPDDSFDVVVSSLAIHNIPGNAGRAKAISEAVRVLRPGGRLMIADIRGTNRHEQQLRKIGMIDVARRRLGWQFWWGGPWAPTRLVTATKAGDGQG